jgi:acetyl-CoA synthetase
MAAPASPEANIADVVVGRHVRAGRDGEVAIRWLGRDPDDLDDPVDLTYGMLDHRSNRFASAMRRHGAGPGAGVATLLGRVPDLFVTALGTFKAHGIFTPLNPAWGSPLVAQSLAAGRTRVLVTTPQLYRRMVVEFVDRLPELDLVLVCGATEDQTAQRSGNGTNRPSTAVSLGSFLNDGTDEGTVAPTDPEQPAMLHVGAGAASLAGTVITGHGDVTRHLTSAPFLDLRAGDVYWCSAPLGAAATSVGMFAPLAAGVTAIVDEAEFDCRRWLHILDRYGVAVLHTSPSTLQMLHGSGIDPHDRERFGSLRLLTTESALDDVPMAAARGQHG